MYKLIDVSTKNWRKGNVPISTVWAKPPLQVCMYVCMYKFKFSWTDFKRALNSNFLEDQRWNLLSKLSDERGHLLPYETDL